MMGCLKNTREQDHSHLCIEDGNVRFVVRLRIGLESGHGVVGLHARSMNS